MQIMKIALFDHKVAYRIDAGVIVSATEPAIRRNHKPEGRRCHLTNRHRLKLGGGVDRAIHISRTQPKGALLAERNLVLAYPRFDEFTPRPLDQRLRNPLSKQDDRHCSGGNLQV